MELKRKGHLNQINIDIKMLKTNFSSITENETKKIAQKLYKLSEKGDILGLSGEMGSGKTTFARYFIQEGSKNEIVPSPTYNIYFRYNTEKFPIYHLDAWRLKNPKELINLGIMEYLEYSILIVEWPENIKDFLPSNMLHIKFYFKETNRRLLLVGDNKWEKRIKSKLNG